MKTNEKSHSSKDKAVSNDEIQRAIAAKTAEFLKQGGQIQQIPKGITGQTNLIKPKTPVKPNEE